MMFKSLTEKYEFVKQFDELAAEIYMDKHDGLLTLNMVAEHRELHIDLVKDKYKIARLMLKNKNEAWLHSGNKLSNRAKKALLKNGYKDLKALHDDIRAERVDLESLSRVGHKVAVEIRKWCAKHPLLN